MSEKMQPTAITLGVENIQKARKFYEEMGFTATSFSDEHLVVFQTGGTALCLYSVGLLSEDITIEASGSGFRKMTLSYNVREKEEVRKVLSKALGCGATIIKEAQDVFWGGHSGYFSDLDGHIWEVAWNPYWKLGENGLFQFD